MCIRDRDKSVREMRAKLEALKRPDSPFSGPTLDDRIAIWVKPDVRVEIEYANRTAANILRAPIFKGLTPRGSPPEVLQSRVKEVEAPASAGEDVVGQLTSA